MKSTLTSLAAATLLATMVSGQTHYRVTDLGLVGGPPGQPFHITNNGQIAGAVQANPSVWHAVLWDKGQRMIDIGSTGLGGPSSVAFWLNERGEAAGQAETNFSDQNGEDFCGFGSHLVCLPFRWESGTMRALPTLAVDKSGVANAINSRGESAGASENANLDSTCPPFDPSLLQFQKYQFKPVMWGTDGQKHELPTIGTDPDGIVLAMNDKGQMAGGTGICTAFQAMGDLTYLYSQHAVVWQGGKATDIGNLGGIGPGGGNITGAINNQGQAVGSSGLPDGTFHGFLWSLQTGIQDLGTIPANGLIPADLNSVALNINDAGLVVGISFPADPTALPRAFIWEDGQMIDLNSRTITHDLYLFDACSINSRGQIIGLALDSNFNTHGFLLTPV